MHKISASIVEAKRNFSLHTRNFSSEYGAMKAFLKKIIVVTLAILVVGADFTGLVFAKTKTNKSEEKSSGKRYQKKRKSKKSKKAKLGRYRGKRFKYKRGGPDIRVLTKESPYSEIPDNGITPVDVAPSN